MKIGVLEASQFEAPFSQRYGNDLAMYQQLLASTDLDAEFHNYQANLGHFPSSPQDCDAWMFAGSKHSVYEALPWIRKLLNFAAQCYQDGVPTVGICFGHQVLAAALGGKVEQAAQGWGLGVHQYQLYHNRVQQPEWMPEWGSDATIAVNAMHQDQVVQLPRDAEVVAGSAFCPYAIINYASGTAMSIQAHPEFTATFMHEFLRAYGGKSFPADAADSAIHTLDTATDSATVAQWIANFLQQQVSYSQSSNHAVVP